MQLPVYAQDSENWSILADIDINPDNHRHLSGTDV